MPILDGVSIAAIFGRRMTASFSAGLIQLCHQIKNTMKKLKMERDSMEKELQARVAMQDMLKEKLSSKEEEFESLQMVAENLRRQIRKLKIVLLCFFVVFWLLI